MHACNLYLWIEAHIEFLNLIIVLLTLFAILRYTRSTIELQKESVQQTNAMIKQTKAVEAQAELFQKQIDINILPSFQMEIEPTTTDKKIKVIIENIGNGVGLNIYTLGLFDSSREDVNTDYIPILKPGGKRIIPPGILDRSFQENYNNSKTTFIFCDILGQRYQQILTIKKGVHKHGFVERLPIK
jgi:hypothetical protein